MVEQLYTGCLAQGAYYIESNGEAAIIDPLRETAPYIAMAEKRGAKIKYILETHFHADFVSGHVDLAKETGAKIVYGPNANAKYDIHVAKDEEILELGDFKIKVLHTPGHTMESSCYLLMDENGKETSVFTGDTLFIGDVGRPDLAQKSDLTIEDLASHLYDSLRIKIMTLPDEVVVYPGHGAGSACGKKMSDETVSSIGDQKKSNYALRADMTKEEFIKEVTDGLQPPPGYFPENVMMNKSGYSNINEVLKASTKALNYSEFKNMLDEGVVLVDGRTREEYLNESIPRSIFIGLDEDFAPWLGALIKGVDSKIIYIAPEGRAEEMALRMSRVGYDNAQGYLKGGLNAWKENGGEVFAINAVSSEEFASAYNSNINIVDVRRIGEFEEEHIDGATNAPLDYLPANLESVPKTEPIYVHCRSGYRSIIASSILRNYGFKNIINIKDGYKGIAETNIPRKSELELV
jgi:glyoxylase-like metal-dependent hydrolase (beta-lactamase superfamily II)/rhodanese-related sulfurtransferase